MGFVRRYVDAAYLPETRGQKLFLLSPATLFLVAKNVYRIDLGLWVPYLPEGTIINFIDIHPKFNILNKYLVASTDELRLIVFVENTVIIDPKTLLCEIRYVPTSSLLPGTFYFFFNTVKKVNLLCLKKISKQPVRISLCRVFFLLETPHEVSNFPNFQLVLLKYLFLFKIESAL